MLLISKNTSEGVIQGHLEDIRGRISFEDLMKIFDIKEHSRILGRSLRSNIFEIKGQSRIFGRSFISQILQGSAENLRGQRSFKDIPKLSMIKDHSKIFGRLFEVKDL